MTSFQVSTIAALKAIPAEAYRVNGYPQCVITSGTGLGSSWYIGIVNAAWGLLSPAASTLGDVIVQPDDEPPTFRWVKMSNLVHYASTEPTHTPLYKGIIWVASLTSPTRRVCWISTDTSSLADWTPIGNPVLTGTVAPPTAFAPDFRGQHYVNTTANALFIGEDVNLDTDWVARVSGGGGGGS